jgi:hypothetical protein
MTSECYGTDSALYRVGRENVTYFIQYPTENRHILTSHTVIVIQNDPDL